MLYHNLIISKKNLITIFLKMKNENVLNIIENIFNLFNL